MDDLQKTVEQLARSLETWRASPMPSGPSQIAQALQQNPTRRIDAPSLARKSKGFLRRLRSRRKAMKTRPGFATASMATETRSGSDIGITGFFNGIGSHLATSVERAATVKNQYGAIDQRIESAAQMSSVFSHGEIPKIEREEERIDLDANSEQFLTEAEQRRRNSTTDSETLAITLGNTITDAMSDVLNGILEPLDGIAELVKEWFGFSKTHAQDMEVSHWLARIEFERIRSEENACLKRDAARGVRAAQQSRGMK